MTKPKPPRVLNYDPEFGYVVAGTHDAELAERLLREHLIGYTFDAEEIDSLIKGCNGPQLIWMRCSMAYRDVDGDHAWMKEDTEPHARGAFMAVEWSR